MLLKSQTPGCGGSAECFLFKMPQGSTEPESSPLLQAMQGQREETGRSAEGGWCRSGSGRQSTGGGFPESLWSEMWGGAGPELRTQTQLPNVHFIQLWHGIGPGQVGAPSQP